MARQTGKAQQSVGPFKLYDEQSSALEPIPFVTARRFWLLVYMLAGSTGLAMLLARFLVRPIMLRVLKSQQDFQQHVHQELSAFIANLSKSITSLPGRSIIVDTSRHRLYVNTETQTETNDGGESQTIEPAKEEVVKQITLAGIPAKLADAGQEAEEALYGELSSKMGDLKAYLNDLDSYTFRTSYGSFGNSSTSNSSGGETMQKVKAEIRSVKGSLLNARTFQSMSRPSITADS